MNLRSLALLVSLFGASAAFAGYLGMKYGEPVTQQQAQPATPPALSAPPQPSAAASPALSKPRESAVPPMPARETMEPPTLQSASEKNNPQEVQSPARNDLEMSGSSTLEAARTTGSQAMESPKCNKEACADAFRSFDATDCTFQPTNGPRRVCKLRR